MGREGREGREARADLMEADGRASISWNRMGWGARYPAPHHNNGGKPSRANVAQRSPETPTGSVAVPEGSGWPGAHRGAEPAPWLTERQAAGWDRGPGGVAARVVPFVGSGRRSVPASGGSPG